MTSVRKTDRYHFIGHRKNLFLNENNAAMKTFTSESGTENIQPVDWEKLYVLTRYWRSDLEFYLEDMRFLNKLIGKYSIWLKRNENSETVSRVARELLGLTENGENLLVRVKEHFKKIGNLIKHKNKEKSEELKMDHEALENEISQFVKDFRTNRRQVFKVSEKVIDSENLTDLMQE